MPNYNNGKIYKITSQGKMYIGSTTQLLSQALAGLKYNSTQAIKNIILDKNCEITLIENFPCNSREELLMRQRYHIENNPNCINNKKVICSEEERNNSLKQKKKDKYQREKLEKKERDFNKMLMPFGQIINPQ